LAVGAHYKARLCGWQKQSKLSNSASSTVFMPVCLIKASAVSSVGLWNQLRP